MMKIKRDDTVVVISGKYKGKFGKVIRVLRTPMEEQRGMRIVVEGINMAKKHVKPNPKLNQGGGIIEKELPVHISNVAIYNPKTKKGDRVGIKVLGDNKKVRIFKSSGEQIDI